MTNPRWIYLIITLLILASNDAVWARGGHGGWHHTHGSYHGHRHTHLNLGINVGRYYNNPGFYGSGFYGPRFFSPRFYGPGFYGYRSYSYGYADPFYNAPFYNYPPVVLVPSRPPVYIQREQAQPVQPQTNYWHYCQNPEGYYPYVRNCPGGWLQVAPQPPAQ